MAHPKVNIHSQKLEQQTQTPEAKQEENRIFHNQSVDDYLQQQRSKFLCAFCGHPSLIEANETGITLCIHCFRIMQAKIDGLKLFLDCH